MKPKENYYHPHSHPHPKHWFWTFLWVVLYLGSAG